MNPLTWQFGEVLVYMAVIFIWMMIIWMFIACSRTSLDDVTSRVG